MSGEYLRPTWGLVPIPLRQFHAMAGRLVILEVGLRQGLQQGTISEKCEALISMIQTLLLPFDPDNTEYRSASISLAATCRKLLSNLLEQSSSKSLPMELSVLGRLIVFYHEIIKSLESDHTKTQPAVDGSSTLSVGPGGTSHHSMSRSDAIHHLQAVLLVSWVQVCHYTVSLPNPGCCSSHSCRSCKPRWLDARLQELWIIREGLLEVVVPLLEIKLPHSIKLQAEVASTWERYAVTHFNGRLVPGCCHLGCSNLSGVSEAMLGTQLCSGCRKARYCSVECQRAAWSGGGHSTVCKE